MAGDFNGDGQLDLAVSSAAGVQILLGNGDGTFQPPRVTYAVGYYPGFIVAGDFNGDGKLDVAVADLGDPLGHRPPAAPSGGERAAGQRRRDLPAHR